MFPTATKPIDIKFWPNRIRFGAGEVSHLGERLAELGAARALVVCGRTVAAGEQLVQVRKGLGGAYVGVFSEIKPHSPLSCLERGVAMARELNADAIISVGGGSAIDGCKGIVLNHATKGDIKSYAIPHGSGGTPGKLLERSSLVHIAVPTTTGSGSEVTPTCGILDTEHNEKLMFRDRRLTPDLALLDPEMTRATSRSLTASSTITAVARSVECFYSATRNPVSDSLAMQALKLMARGLPVALDNPNDIQARSDCQFGCSLASIAMLNAMPCIIHAIGHVIGARYRLPHGTSHAVLVAPAMRMMLPIIGEMQRQVLEALGGSAAALSPDQAGIEAAKRMAALVAGLGMASRLRDVGIAESDVPGIAESARTDFLMTFSPRPITTPEIAALIMQVW